RSVAASGAGVAIPWSHAAQALGRAVDVTVLAKLVRRPLAQSSTQRPPPNPIRAKITASGARRGGEKLSLLGRCSSGGQRALDRRGSGLFLACDHHGGRAALCQS